MRGFVARRGELVAEMDRTERTIIARVVADTSLLLGVPLRPVGTETRGDDDRTDPAPSGPFARMSWSAEDVQAPSDPALARLLPPASTEDDGVAEEFRRLTEADLRSAKTERLRMVFDELTRPGQKVRVRAERAMDWAAALTDVRLVLAQRLGIETDADAEEVYSATGQDEDEVRAAMATLYSALTWLQESLLQVMIPTLEP